MRSSVSAARSRLGAVLGQVASLRLALLSPTPEKIAECVPGLVEAAEQLASIERQLRERPDGDREFEGEIKLLKNELRLVARQIEQGAEFYRGWARLLGTAMSGYTPAGEAGPVSAAGSISLQG